MISSRFGLSRYDADALYAEALKAYKKKDLEEALIKMGQAIALVPNNSEYYAARGLIHYEHGLPDKANHDFEQALAIHEYEMLAQLGLGMLAYQSKDWETALEHLTKAWAVQNDRPETLYYLALTHHRLGKNREALAWMQQAEVAFQAKMDRRRTQASKWVDELQKLVDKLDMVGFEPPS